MRERIRKGRGKFGPILGLLVALLMGGTNFSRAFAGEVSKGNDILVFVDETGSTGRQFEIYRRALLSRIVPGLRGGDRLRVLPIDDDSSLISDFLAQGSLSVAPSFDGFSDNELEYKAKVKAIRKKNREVRQQLLTMLQKALAKPGRSAETDIFGATRMASQLLSADKRRPVVVFLSDMQEDRGRFRYKNMTFGKKDLARVGTIYGFPDLKNVCVYVVGTRSDSIERTRKMLTFWEDYFKKSGAAVTPDHMVSMLVNWPPKKSCGSPRVREKTVLSWFDRLRREF